MPKRLGKVVNLLKFLIGIVYLTSLLQRLKLYTWLNCFPVLVKLGTVVADVTNDMLLKS